MGAVQETPRRQTGPAEYSSVSAPVPPTLHQGFHTEPGSHLCQPILPGKPSKLSFLFACGNYSELYPLSSKLRDHSPPHSHYLLLHTEKRSHRVSFASSCHQTPTWLASPSSPPSVKGIGDISTCHLDTIFSPGTLIYRLPPLSSIPSVSLSTDPFPQLFLLALYT